MIVKDIKLVISNTVTEENGLIYVTCTGSQIPSCLCCGSDDELPFDSFIIAISILIFLCYQNCKINISPPFFSGKLLGCYIGKCSGSIRSIVRHPELPLIASCGEATSRKAYLFLLGCLFHLTFQIVSVTN